MNNLAILGASGHGKVVAEIAELCGWKKITFYDDNVGDIECFENWTITGTSDDMFQNSSQFDGCIVAIGNNFVRDEKSKLLVNNGATLVSLFHPSSVISKYANIELGTVIMANAVINPFVKIGMACIVNTAATIDHDCTIMNGVHVSPGAHLAGSVSIGERSWVGIGACIKQSTNIGSDVCIGAGACVVSDISNGETVVGVPAKGK